MILVVIVDLVVVIGNVPLKFRPKKAAGKAKKNEDRRQYFKAYYAARKSEKQRKIEGKA